MKTYVLRQGELQPFTEGEAAHLTSTWNFEGLEELFFVRYQDQVYPVWLVPTAQQDPQWPADNWSVKLARCRTTAELFEEIQHLTPPQARLLFSTLPSSLLDGWTGYRWQRSELAQSLYQVVAQRFEESLQKQGIQTAELPLLAERVEPPLDIPQLLPVSTQVTSESGRGVAMVDLDLSPAVQQAISPLVRDGNLFLHQALALKYLRAARTEGNNIILSTPTASGKTVSFLPGILEELLKSGGNALFLYPLTALCRDQFGTIEKACAFLPAGQSLRLARFIGDDRLDEQAEIPNLLVATPDKLNNHLTRKEIQAFLARVKYIVLDEAHTYRGAFGTHMSAFLRRLLVIAQSQPSLIISSATLKNTVQFAQNLTGKQHFRVVGVSTAPRYPRHLYVSTQTRYTKQLEQGHGRALRNLSQVVRDRRSKGLVFLGRRSATRYVAKSLQLRSDPVEPPVAFPFYSGMPAYKERLQHLKSGSGPAIAVSTTTLEAGIDIGALDIVGIVGFPRTRNSFKQMAGRAGRAGTAHVAFMPGRQPPDEYYSQPQNLERLLLAESEPVYVNPYNPVLLKGHIQRLRYEMRQIGEETGPQLLQRFFSEGLPEQVEKQLLLLFDEDVQAVPAPPLRGEPGVPHLVIRSGGDADPHQSVSTVVLPEESPEWLIEQPNAENAAKEWGPQSMVIRSDRFYQVLDWQRGEVTARGRTEKAVLIRVLDKTEQVLDPIDVVRARRGLQEWPDGGIEPHSHDGKVEVQVEFEEVIQSRKFGLLQGTSGAGRVSILLRDQRDRSAQQVRCSCPGAKVKFRLPHQAPAAFQVVLRQDDGREEALGQFQADQWKVWQQGRVSITNDKDTAAFYVVEAREMRQDKVTLLVRLHSFDSELPGECICGATTEARYVWETSTEDVPECWSGHPVFTMMPRTFTTDVAQVIFEGTSSPALEAFGTALVKALPDIMEVDPQEIGVQAGSVAGKAQLTFWDTTAGGTGVSLEIPNYLPQLLRGARDLLALADQCSCEGEGCFGCIQPFSALQWEHSPGIDDLDEQEAEMMGSATDAALHFAEQLLASLPTEQEGVDTAIKPVPAFRQVILELEGNVRHPDQTLAPGVLEVLKTCKEQRVEVSLVTNSPREKAALFLEESLPELAAGLVGSLIADAGLPSTEKVRHLVPEERPDRLLWVSTSAAGLTAARDLEVTTALMSPQDSPRSLDQGPDLLLETPEQLAAALFKPLAFAWPLEQATLNPAERHAPLCIYCPEVGLKVQVLGRYFPARILTRHSRLRQASQQVLSFKDTGTLASLVCETLQVYYPNHLLVFMPSSGKENVLGTGLGVVRDLLVDAQRKVASLYWLTPPERKQKYAGGVQGRIRNIQGRLGCTEDVKGKQVLLIDDVVTTGATLAEGRQVLEALGAEVVCFAVAHTMRTEKGQP